ncbi:hypothetical protein [Segniliparus rugosus]|uniref:Uncharacterized protein n=1 Tax=Segniliparus rugosus (strain ATCC BAA-974 / DSM 45345 / CCUG 50838 / CIP 108380 / JCM 13579 / CDC 945) TaxID=679197 RepID=E5XT00_SEGRC|nr:hypothetical protein [Segniliparus rugosus]EFV12542.2 hypothetical protein HMPREF9336_02622 [Segniliparus rugosus ATCC BAA-974]
MGDDPDPPGVAFAAGVALCVAGCVLVAASSLASVLRRLELLRVGGSLARVLRGSWTVGALCAMSGLLVLVGLGIVMTALSQLTTGGKAFVTVVFALCALVPVVPGFEIWRRRAGGKAD